MFKSGGVGRRERKASRAVSSPGIALVRRWHVPLGLMKALMWWSLAESRPGLEQLHRNRGMLPGAP